MYYDVNEVRDCHTKRTNYEMKSFVMFSHDQYNKTNKTADGTSIFLLMQCSSMPP